MTNTADLTVILCNYNHARYLPRCVESILSQSVQAREFLILDDRSTDNSLEILQGYAARHSCIRLIRHETNRGVTHSYNAGVQLAKGKFVYLGGADDYVLPGFFEKTMTAVESQPGTMLSCGIDSHAYGYDGEIRHCPTRWSENAKFFQPDDVARIVTRNVSAQASIVRRDAHLAIGMYRPELAWYSDWFAYLCIALRHGMMHIPEAMAVRTLGMPNAYSNESHIRGTERHIEVLGNMLDLMLSAEFADIAPRFRRCGAVHIFGTDLIRAAVRRPNYWRPEILGMLNGYSTEEYHQASTDPDPRVREIAELFLGIARREEREETQTLKREIELIRGELPPRGVLPKMRWAIGKAMRRMRKMASRAA